MALLRLFEILGFIAAVIFLLLFVFKGIFGKYPWNYGPEKKQPEQEPQQEPTTPPQP